MSSGDVCQAVASLGLLSHRPSSFEPGLMHNEPQTRREVPSGFRQAFEASCLNLSSSLRSMTGRGNVDVSAHLILLLLSCFSYHSNRDVRAVAKGSLEY